jgi:hypothetical protein
MSSSSTTSSFSAISLGNITYIFVLIVLLDKSETKKKKDEEEGGKKNKNKKKKKKEDELHFPPISPQHALVSQ